MGWLLTSLAVCSPDSLKIHVCLSAVNTKLILNKEMEQHLSPGDVFLGHTLFPAPAAPPQLPSAALHGAFLGHHRSFPALCYPTSPLLTALLSEGRVSHRREMQNVKAPASSAELWQLHPTLNEQRRGAAAKPPSLPPTEQRPPAAFSSCDCTMRFYPRAAARRRRIILPIWVSWCRVSNSWCNSQAYFFSLSCGRHLLFINNQIPLSEARKGDNSKFLLLYQQYW